MPRVTFLTAAGQAYQADGPAGTTIMELAVKNRIPQITGDCGGACACATCHVYVDGAWLAKTGTPSMAEADMLDFADNLRANSRLGCQLTLKDEWDGLVLHLPPVP
jgi:ferredoxin, 2Fe-2S